MKFRCPSFADVLSATLALLPRGRAWQTHEGGPLPGAVEAFNPDAFNVDAFSTENRRASIIWQFWAAAASLFTFVNQRLCDLRLEFWCATQSETHDLWLIEYGLPDLCDPFPDVCTKVAAIGGTRCEYFAAIAARAGWVIDCSEAFNECGTLIGSAGSLAGRMRPGHRRAAMFVVRVFLAESPAFTGDAFSRAQAKRFRTGRRLMCGPNISGLQCLMARMVHAELLISYEVIA